MTRKEAKSILGDVRAYLASRASLENESLAGHSFIEICNAIKALKQEPKTEWIPISERLPEDGTWNLWTNGKQISIERYKTDALDHFYPSGRWFSLEEAIAWQPLPEPYKKGE